MPTNTKETESVVFHRLNYLIIFLSCIAIVVGYVLMAGNGSTESSFCPEIFSKRRIVIAPFMCFMGYVSMIVGIVLPHGKSRRK